MLQWQKCVGTGREEVGMVKERLEDLQRHWAWKVRVFSAILLEISQESTVEPRKWFSMAVKVDAG
jgi:hypothetical protein